MDKYFKNITTLEELRKQYKELLKIHHPDNGGDVEIMQEVNAEYDSLFKICMGVQRLKLSKGNYCRLRRLSRYLQNGDTLANKNRSTQFCVHLTNKDGSAQFYALFDTNIGRMERI